MNSHSDEIMEQKMQIRAMSDDTKSLKSDLKVKEEENQQHIRKIQSLEEQIAALQQSQTAKQEEQTNVMIEKNQRIEELEKAMEQKRIEKEEVDRKCEHLIAEHTQSSKEFQNVIGTLKDKVVADEKRMEELNRSIEEEKENVKVWSLYF